VELVPAVGDVFPGDGQPGQGSALEAGAEVEDGETGCSAGADAGVGFVGGSESALGEGGLGGGFDPPSGVGLPGEPGSSLEGRDAGERGFVDVVVGSRPGGV
jgi:hypothetical protein